MIFTKEQIAKAKKFKESLVQIKKQSGSCEHVLCSYCYFDEGMSCNVTISDKDAKYKYRKKVATKLLKLLNGENIIDNVKAKVRFTKFERAVVMEVFETDKRFRKVNNICPCYTSKNNIKISSMDDPCISGDVIYLHGIKEQLNNRLGFRYFESNEDRDIWIKKVEEALKEWAENWEGFKEDKIKEENKNNDNDSNIVMVTV